MTEKKFHKYNTNEEVIYNFTQGATHGQNHTSSMFIEDNILYSYGHHFPLLVRHPQGLILNAEKYSVTTLQHQSLCFSYAYCQFPFGMMTEVFSKYIKNLSSDNFAKQILPDIKIKDKTSQRWDLVGYYHFVNGKREHISAAQYKKLTSYEKKSYYKLKERRPEALLLEYKGQQYLSSMDGQQYFISMLPENVNTVEEAFESLKPKELEEINKYERQGEWFFVELEVDKKEARKTYKCFEQNFELPKDDPDSNSHTATRGGFLFDIAFKDIPKLPFNARTIVVSGQVRHSQHRMLKLSLSKEPKLFAACKNRAIRSWSVSDAGVRID